MFALERHMSIKEYLEEKRRIVDDALATYLPEDDSVLSDAMRYSALSPGKRIRAILAFASAEAVGGDERQVLPVACVIELLHSFSLIHDDLPAMDDDDMRRGLPTSHVKYGEATAILAGDALFALAYEVMSHGSRRQNVSSDRIADVISNVSSAVGFRGMCSGQSIDLLSEGKDISLELLEEIHRKKTGALISASVYAGAKIAGASENELRSLHEYSSHIGLAFQIKDDILDVSGTFEEIGKNPGSDVHKKKATFPSLLGIDKSIMLMNEEKKMAYKALGEFGEKSKHLAEIADFIIERNT